MDTSFNLKQKVSPFTIVFLVAVVVGALAFILGRYHIVYNTDEILIKRPYFGYSDIIGDVNECVGVPYIVSIATHNSLCRALEDAGYISH